MKSSATTADRAALGVDAIDVVAVLLLGLVALVVGKDAVGRIGEPDRAVGLHHHVVRRVELLALVAVGDHRGRAVMLGARHAPPAVLAGDEASLPVDGVAVGVAAGRAEHRDRAVGLVVAHDAVVRDVGEQDVFASWKVHRPLGPARAGPELLHMRGAVHAVAESLVQDLVVAGGHLMLRKGHAAGRHHSGFIPAVIPAERANSIVIPGERSETRDPRCYGCRRRDGSRIAAARLPG